MDFLVYDNKDQSRSKCHRLVKRTPFHLILVTYEIKQRLVCPPEPEENPDMILSLQQNTFGHFLKKHGMVPPNMMGREFDEDEIMKEELEARRDKRKAVMDHVDDRTNFEISIINKKDMCLTVDCQSYNGEITFGKVLIN